MRLAVWVIATGLVLACGGDTEAKAPTNPAPAQSTKPKKANPEPVPDEVFDATISTFRRKSSSMSRCYAEAVAAQEIAPTAKGSITVETVIVNGKATQRKVRQSDIASQTLQSCVLETVGLWSFPKHSTPFDFSHVFHFQGG